MLIKKGILLMKIAKNWENYECLDIGEGYKIERFGEYILKRPEPTAGGELDLQMTHFDGEFINGQWEHHLPESWILEYKDMKFELKLSEFKHLGIFPEQALNWDLIRSIHEKHKEPMRILNLFGYTGGATVASAWGNVEEVVHVDALKSANMRTQENLKLNNLEDKHVRTLVDDVLKFIEKEKRRGRTYHGIIMDPPSFGRGPKKEVWKIEEQLETLIQGAVELLDEDAVFLILNTYSRNLTPSYVLRTLKTYFNPEDGKFDSSKIGLPIKNKPFPLKAGNTTRWCKYGELMK